MAEKQSESVQKKLSLSLDEIIALNNKQQKQQRQANQRQEPQGPVRRQTRRPFQPVASPYKRPINAAFGNRPGHPWPRLEQMIRKVFGGCGDITRIVRRNDGSAWVQYADVNACRRALAELQNAKVGGQAVTVERVREREPSRRSPLSVAEKALAGLVLGIAAEALQGNPVGTSPAPGLQGGWQSFSPHSPGTLAGGYGGPWGSHNGDVYASAPAPFYHSFSRPAPAAAPSARNPMVRKKVARPKP